MSKYIGNELELFAAAVNWKSYVRSHVRPFLGGDVLEVGAGIGGTTRLLCAEQGGRWVCLEPDPDMAETLVADRASGRLPSRCEVMVGTIGSELVVESAPFQCILYIDVLEHIEDDAAEVALASERLAPGGYLVVLAPAHQWLYTAFDRSIGHYRRYTRRSLLALTPPELIIARARYLDSVGLLAALGNRLLLKQSLPTPRQISVWDRGFVPVSRLLDPCLGFVLGKSVLAVWRKPANAGS